MKKKLLIPLAVLASIAFASCDSKPCYCFERGYDGRLIRSEIYVSSDTPCNSQTTDSRGCIERSELGTINPEDIAK